MRPAIWGMPRKKLNRNSSLAYHVCGRTNNAEWFPIPLSEVWTIFCHHLERVSGLNRPEIGLFVLMANHFHMILSTPLENLDEIMRNLLTEVSKAIRSASGRKNHIFGPRYKWSLLPDSESLAYVYKYVARNPAKAGLVTDIFDYEFSSLSRLYRGRSCPPITEGFKSYWSCIPRQIQDRRDWLNIPTPKEHDELIRRGLRRTSFQLTTSNQFIKTLAELKTSLPKRCLTPSGEICLEGV